MGFRKILDLHQKRLCQFGMKRFTLLELPERQYFLTLGYTEVWKASPIGAIHNRS
jgi:hypothetical protein